MSKSVTTSAIAAVSKFAYSEALKPMGFKRIGNHMFKPSEDLFHGIHFQASQWGTLEQGAFTINLVVTSAILYESWTGVPLPRNPASAMFPIDQRLGSLMPEAGDRWWTVSQKTDITALQREILHNLSTFAMPFFGEFPNSKAILDRLRQNKSLPGLYSGQYRLIHAILANAVGFPDEASDQIQISLKNAASSPFKATIEQVGKRIGLLEKPTS